MLWVIKEWCLLEKHLFLFNISIVEICKLDLSVSFPLPVSNKSLLITEGFCMKMKKSNIFSHYYHSSIINCFYGECIKKGSNAFVFSLCTYSELQEMLQMNNHQ